MLPKKDRHAVFFISTSASILEKMKHTLQYHLKRYSFYLGGDQPAVAWVESLRSLLGGGFCRPYVGAHYC
jgi:hypothetical protein